MNGERVLVVQTAFLGDVILTTGLLSYLAERFGPVDIVTTPAASPLVSTHPAVGRAWTYDKRGAVAGTIRGFRLASAVREIGYSRVYLPHRSPRSAILVRVAGIPERIGFADAPGSQGYTRRIPRPGSGHEAERILALAEPEPGTVARVTLGLTPDDYRLADEWLAARAIPPGFVAMAPGSIWGTKKWPWYAELAGSLAEPVVVVGGPEDRDLALAVAAGKAGVYSAAGALPLRASAALLARARVLVTNDSAPLHMATAVGTRVVSIFGPTVPAFGFGPRGASDRIVEHDNMPCRPCSSHGPQVCPLGHHRCMRDLDVGRVLEAVSTNSE